jgi:aromatic-L-amino-acid decarboxylase
MNLDYPLPDFKNILNATLESVLRLYETLKERPVYQNPSVSDVKTCFAESLPLQGTSPLALIQKIEQDVFNNATLCLSPKFFAYVCSGGTQMGIIGDLFISALNQNCGKWHLSACNAEMEQQVLEWLSAFIGYVPSAGGSLVSGGSAANLTCLSVARKIKAPLDITKEGLFGAAPLTLYVSVEGHSCLDKSVELLGIGRKQLRKVPVLEDFTIDVEQLETMIQQDLADGCLPIAIIGNAGTVNTGAIDPLDALAELAVKYNLWFHVDGAYGALGAASPVVNPLYKGLDRADSIAMDPHKWLYVPFEAGCALIRDWDKLHKTFHIRPDYLALDSGDEERFDSMEYNFQLSRSFKALKVWLTFKTYGAENLSQAITDNIQLMQYLAEQVEASDDFELMAPTPLSIVCFRYLGQQGQFKGKTDILNTLNQQILNELEADGRFFMTGSRLHGQTVLRACCVNHRASQTHVDGLLAVLRELASEKI